MWRKSRTEKSRDRAWPADRDRRPYLFSREQPSSAAATSERATCANTTRGRGIAVLCRTQASRGRNAPFPLTLTLSLREREQLSERVDSSEARRALAASGSFAERTGRIAGCVDIAHNRGRCLPLPKGEG